MSQSNNKHRRTPLSLGQGNQKHGNGRKNSNDSVDSHKLSASVVVIDKMSSIDNVTSSKAEQSKQKPDANVATKEKVKENGSNQQKNGSSTKNGNGLSAEKAVAAVAPTQKDASKEVEVKESKKEEPVKREDKKREEKETPKKEDKAAKNGNEESATKSKNVEPSDVIRESPRQKEIREKEEEKSKIQEQKEIAEAIAVFKAQEDVESLTPPTVTVTPATPDVKSVESPSSKKRSSTNSTPVKGSPGSATPTRPIVADPSVSLLQQSELYGFGSDVDEMESLRMDTDGYGDSPMPKSAKAVGKILKFSQSPLPNRARVSPFRRVAETNASTFVNLSTVSEMSTEASNSPAVIVVGAATVPGEHHYGSYRHISGRKSTKPLRELTLQNTVRESYRRIKTDLDDSISSVNATMGSEINHGSFSTPVVAVKGRKRTNIGGSEPDLTSVTESPKKARLDFSGFLGIMASPVTLLRNKFSRTSLLCSTPNGKKLNIDTAETEEAEVDQAASGVVDVDMVSVDLTEQQEPNKTDVEVDVASVSNKMDDSLDVVPVDANEIVIETEQLKSVDDIKDKIAEEEARQDEAEAVAGTDAPKKGRCAIM